MAKFINRLKYYGIGFGFGLLFVFFFFKNRGCSWTPSNRVKNTILDKVLVVPTSELDQIKAKGISEEDFKSLLNDGDVDFENSIKETNVYPKVYLVEKEIDGEKLRAQFSLFEDSFITVGEILTNDEKVEKHLDYSGYGKMLRFPADSSLIYLKKASSSGTDSLALINQNPQQVLQYLKATGEIDFDKSNLMAPKAEHAISYIDNKGNKIKGNAIWFKTKISFNHIESVK